jgi:hypothetical protein
MPQDTPPAEWLNWIFGNPSDWIDYLDDWIQNIATPEANDLERMLEMQALVPARNYAQSPLPMQIKGCAAVLAGPGALASVVGVGMSGTIVRYDAVRTEVTNPAPASGFTGAFNDVICGNSLYVAVGTNGTNAIIQTSGTGTGWTQRLSVGVSGASFTSVAYGNLRYIAVGVSAGASICYTSTDGVTWTFVTSTIPPILKVIYVGGTLNRFFAATADGIYSTPASAPDWQGAALATLGGGAVFDMCWSAAFGIIVLSRSTADSKLYMFSSATGASGSFASVASGGTCADTNLYTLVPLNRQILVLFAVSATTYGTLAMFLQDLTVAPEPAAIARSIPNVLGGAAVRIKIVQNMIMVAANTSATAATIFCFGPLESLRGLGQP